ncbi:MAG: hypothetical protein H7836_13985 [Magnetococcus sp. YQC-3]
MLLVVCLLLVAARPLAAETVDISSLDHPLAVQLLTSAWLLLEQEEQKTRIRVYRVDVPKTEPCDSLKYECQWERLAISIATTGAQPASRLYLSRPARRWYRPKVVRLVDAKRLDAFSIISAEEYAIEITKEEKKDQRMGRDRHRQRTFFVNLHSAHLCKE